MATGTDKGRTIPGGPRGKADLDLAQSGRAQGCSGKGTGIS